MLTYCHIVQLMWVTSDVTTSQEVLLQKKCSLTCAFLSNVCNAQLMPRVLVNTNSLQCFFYLYINIHIFINQYFCFFSLCSKRFLINSIKNTNKEPYIHELQSSFPPHDRCHGRSSGPPPTEPAGQAFLCAHLLRHKKPLSGPYNKHSAAEEGVQSPQNDVEQDRSLVVTQKQSSGMESTLLFSTHHLSLREKQYVIFLCSP